MSPYLLAYRLLLPLRYGHYLKRANGNRDKCHEALLHGTFYEEYDLYNFADRNDAQRREYLTDALRNKICRRINSRKGERIVADKWLTYQHWKKHYHRRIWRLNGDPDTLHEACTAAMQQGALVVKPGDSCGGRGVRHLIAENDTQWQKTLLDCSGMIAEECIVQDAYLARWNPSSVNTIRMNTFLLNGKVSLFTSFIRTGRQGSFVDNGAAGGLFASIDTSTGTIITDGYDEQGIRYASHPDSNIPFCGEKIPHWNTLQDLATTMALEMPSMTYIGWDFALTPDGWEPVEANRGEFVAQQVTLQRGLRREFETACGLRTP